MMACTKTSDEQIEPIITAPILRCAPDVEPLPSRIQRGMSVAHNYQAAGSKGYGSKTSATTLAELKELGVGWVSLTPFGFMQRLDEPRVHPIGNYRAGETDERMRREIRKAKETGLEVMLKPHLWVIDGKWRGEIGFDDANAWSRWFDSYEKWMLHYADLAEDEGVGLLVIGVEFRSMESKLEGRWRRLIRKVRRRFHGEITYSANWDDAESVPWWDAVDYIGVQFYPPLAKDTGVGASAIRAEMDRRLNQMGELSAAKGKPVLFTEVGYRASEDALVTPHAWPESQKGAAVDGRAQAIGYAEFVEGVRSRPWVAGVYWWKWFTNPNTTEEGPAGFSPRGKHAEAVLRAAYGGNCAAPTSPR